MDVPMNPTQTTRHGSRRLMLPLVVAYPVLAISGAVWHRPALSLAALLVLLTVIALPMLGAGKRRAWAAWLVGAAVIIGTGVLGVGPILLSCVPVLINLALSWVFGRTLLAGRIPLIARIIASVESPARLEEPGIAPYARNLTRFWACFLAIQAMLLAVLLGCAVPGGILFDLGITPPFAVPAAWAMGYAHAGAYVMIAVTFAAEHVFRQYHLRHVSHPGFRELVMKVAVRWPKLVRGQGLDH
jgi:uncharacterized membrane protein